MNKLLVLLVLCLFLESASLSAGLIYFSGDGKYVIENDSSVWRCKNESEPIYRTTSVDCVKGVGRNIPVTFWFFSRGVEFSQKHSFNDIPKFESLTKEYLKCYGSKNNVIFNGFSLKSQKNYGHYHFECFYHGGDKFGVIEIFYLYKADAIYQLIVNTIGDDISNEERGHICDNILSMIKPIFGP